MTAQLINTAIDYWTQHNPNSESEYDDTVKQVTDYWTEHNPNSVNEYDDTAEATTTDYWTKANPNSAAHVYKPRTDVPVVFRSEGVTVYEMKVSNAAYAFGDLINWA